MWTAVSLALDKRRYGAYRLYCQQRGFHLQHQRSDEDKRHLNTCPLFAQDGDTDWGYTISGSRGGVPFMAFE